MPKRQRKTKVPLLALLSALLAGATTRPATQPANPAGPIEQFNAGTGMSQVRVPLVGVNLLYAFEGPKQPAVIDTLAVHPVGNGWQALDWIIEGENGGWTIAVDLQQGGTRLAAAELAPFLQAKRVHYRLWGRRSKREGYYTDEQVAAVKELLRRTNFFETAPTTRSSEAKPSK